MKKENNKLKAINLSNELKNVITAGSKENLSPFRKDKPLQTANSQPSPSKNRLTSRVSEL
jgi:hypothetical protein